MSSDPIYREEILDHYKYPRNQGRLENADIEVEETNTSCGDELIMQLKLDHKQCVCNVKYQCKGCAISTAVASMLSEAIAGKTVKSLSKLTPEDIYDLLGGPVSTGRIKCATLALKAMQKGIKNYKATKTRKK